jgi:phage shock protein PspC (stress-responsive transcriptional regulator)
MSENDTRTENDLPTGAPESEPYDAPGRPDPHDTIGRPGLYRPIGDRMLAGVAAGIAQYLDLDVTIVRVVLAVLAFAGGAGVPIYLAGWLLIPEEGAEQSIAGELFASFQSRSR